MWAQALRRPLMGVRLHRTVRFARKYNGQQQRPDQYALPHTTYFQQPAQSERPRRRWLRTTLLATGFFTLGSVTGLILAPQVVEFEEIESIAEVADLQSMLDEVPRHHVGLLNFLWDYVMALEVPSQGLEAQNALMRRAAVFNHSKTATHSCSLPSNLPCEDHHTSGKIDLLPEREKNWTCWSIFDGHAGPRTAFAIDTLLTGAVAASLHQSGCLEQKYVPGDSKVAETIKRAFVSTDDLLMEIARDSVDDQTQNLSEKIMATAPALSGSCALMALFDPTNSVLYVANTGDSRAVLGRWDSQKAKYVATPMSHDHTGFNENEVQRLRHEHPGEEPIDPATGRVHGLAVTRAFGDARWKWPNDLTTRVHEKLFGPSPRPNGVIKTPPYLTAEPEVMDMQVRGGEKPDFLIMGSDGLWDNISSEDAITCVQMWLDKFHPAGPPEKSVSGDRLRERSSGLASEDDDTYYDENERSMKWRVSPKHFVVEDDHAGVHLIKNALGGSRKNLFRGLMTLQPPFSRAARDDISVQVIFFGDDFGENTVETVDGARKYAVVTQR